MTIKFLAFCVENGQPYSQHSYSANTLEDLRNTLQRIKDTSENVFEIRKQTISTEFCETVTIPATTYSADEVVQLLSSDIGYQKNWAEYTAYDEYNALSEEDKKYVNETLREMFEACDGCGCYFETGTLSYSEHSGDNLCDRCYNDEEEALEEEERDEED